MRFGRRTKHAAPRRQPRASAFRSADLVGVLRGELGEPLKSAGFKRLGSNAWVRAHNDEHHIVAIQASQSGWDPRSGNRFIVEFERSKKPLRATGFSRARLWRLLDDLGRREVTDLNSRVALTLPHPDPNFLRQLPDGVREHYLQAFSASPQAAESADVWFAYYDEEDAQAWAAFLSRRLEPALSQFLTWPPSFFGHRREEDLDQQ